MQEEDKIVCMARCTECGYEEKLTKDDIGLLIKSMTRFHPNMTGNDLVDMLSHSLDKNCRGDMNEKGEYEFEKPDYHNMIFDDSWITNLDNVITGYQKGLVDEISYKNNKIEFTNIERNIKELRHRQRTLIEQNNILYDQYPLEIKQATDNLLSVTGTDRFDLFMKKLEVK